MSFAQMRKTETMSTDLARVLVRTAERGTWMAREVAPSPELAYKKACAAQKGYIPELFERHHFTLSVDSDKTVTAECSCGLVGVGFTNLTDVFALMEDHGTPL